MALVDEVRKAKDEGKLVIGKNEVEKRLKNKSLKRVILASNCPEETEEDIRYYSSFSDFDIMKAENTNEELGVFCRVSFGISVLGME